MFSLAAQPTDGLSGPSLSFAILVASLLLSSYILWRRYRSRRLLLQRVAELEALSEAGRAIVAAELDVLALCELIAQEAGKVIDNRTFQIGIFENTLYHILFWTVAGQKQETPRTFDLSENSGLIGWIRHNKQPLLIHDFHKEMDSLPARPRYISDTPPRSAIFIPLISGGEVLGIIAAQSAQPNRFNEEDLRRLMILANQAAAAIAHAQLFAEERKRAAYLVLVSQTARQINAINDLEELFSQVVRLIQATFGFHPVSIFTIDRTTGDVVIQACSIADLPIDSVRIARGQGIIGTAAAIPETIVANDTAKDNRFLPSFGLVENELAAVARAEMAIPLVVNGEVSGVLDVQSPRVGAFGPAEKIALEALAAEVAIAIDKARQLARQREHSWITTAQLQVAEAISRSNDLDDIVHTITRLTPMLLGISLCGILLWDEEMNLYRGASLYGADKETPEAFAQLKLKIGDWTALDAVHVGRQTLTTTKIPAWLKRVAAQMIPPLKQITLLPIAVKSEMLGVMFVSELASIRTPVGRLSPQMGRAELLHNIAMQAAQAIESAYLRTAQQEEAWVTVALLQVAEAVNNLTDVNEILNIIVRLTPMLVGMESALVLIWDEERQVFHTGPSYGISKMGRGLLETLAIEQGEFPVIAQHPADLLTPNPSYYAIQLPPWLEKVLGASIAHAFLLHARNRLVGAMVVGTNSENGRALSTRRLNILNGIAHQAATAVVNNQLYKESADRSRLEQELSVAREIQASLIPPGNPSIPGFSVASFWQAAREVSGDFYDFLELPNECWGVVVADVADKGIPAALFMALSRTVLRTVAFSRENPAEVLVRANEIIDKDSQAELFVTLFYAVWDPPSETLTYANAGHNPALLLRKNGKVHLLKGTGMALGVLPKIKVGQKLVRVYPGDTLIFYTDGVTEAMNEDFDEFNLERLRLTAVKVRHLDAPDIIEAITGAIRDYAGDTAQSDDITLVVMKRRE